MTKLWTKTDCWVETIDKKMGNFIFLIIGALLLTYSVVDLTNTLNIGIVAYETIPGSFGAAFTLFALGVVRYYLNYRYRTISDENENGISKDFRNKLTAGLLLILGFSSWPIDAISGAGLDLFG